MIIIETREQSADLNIQLKGGSCIRKTYSYHLHTWNIGDPLEVIERLAKFSDIERIEVDGDELKLIRESFENLPMPNKVSAVWYGETARFILRNL